MDERRYFIREENESSGPGVKFGLKDGGLGSCYNVRADQELLGRDISLV